MYTSLATGELEEKIEQDLFEIAKKCVPDSPEKDDLQTAHDHDPVFFGGDFPALGIDVKISRGRSRFQDRPERPRTVDVDIYIYEPCMPVRGATSREEDRISRARKITRKIRDQYIKKIFEDTDFSGSTEVVESRGGHSDDFANARTDDRQSEILWVDRTRLEISV